MIRVSCIPKRVAIIRKNAAPAKVAPKADPKSPLMCPGGRKR
jgi:hypothetical protein